MQGKPLDGTVTLDGRHFLVANEDGGTVSVIDLAQGRSIDHVAVPKRCEVLGCHPLLSIAKMVAASSAG